MDRTRFWLMLSIPLIGACSPQKDAQTQAKAAPTLYEIMTDRIDPAADAIWTIGNAAIDDQASIDPAKMDDKNWTVLEQAARRLAGHSREMAALDPVIITRPGVKIADEGTEGAPTPAEIQGHIERQPDLYRSMATALAQHGDQLAEAARARNTATAGRLINDLDGVCETCHLEFWYPAQKAMVESIEANAAK